MKLYYSPGACSRAVRIALNQAGLAFEEVKVDLATHKTEDGGDYFKVNPKGPVPALQLDDGSVLTEVPAVLLYVASQAPAGAAGLAPAPGSVEYFRTAEALAWISSELHKAVGPLFSPALSAEAREAALAVVHKKLEYLNGLLSSRETMVAGAGVTVADYLAYVILSWAPYIKVDLSKYGALVAFSERIGALPAVQKAVAAESGGH